MSGVGCYWGPWTDASMLFAPRIQQAHGLDDMDG